MSKIRKISIIMVLIILAILGINTKSNAATLNVDNLYVGATVTNINKYTYYDLTNVYCVEHKQGLSSKMTFKVVNRVDITGLNATSNGKTVTDVKNAQLAYILGSDRSYNIRQNAIWNRIHSWVSTVGTQLGISRSFTNGVKGGTSSAALEKEAIDYANNLQTANNELQDHTNKDAIKTTSYVEGNTRYIMVGPLNWTFPGSLSDVKVYDQDNNVISNVAFTYYEGNQIRKYNGLSDIVSGRNFYVSVPANSRTRRITKIQATANTQVKTATIFFLSAGKLSWQNMIAVKPGTGEVPIENTFEYNIDLTGDLTIEKVDSRDNSVKLQGVGFVIQNKETGKYIYEANGQIQYGERSQAKEYVTNSEGRIEIKGLMVGEYIAYETKNPNYGYQVVESETSMTVVASTTNNKVIPNEQKYIKLSGIVWVDKEYVEKGDSKTEQYNDYYNKGDDTLLDGITVRLKDKNGNIVKNIEGQDCVATTANGGAYLFEGVEVEPLLNNSYYVEFEYNGLTYTNVVPHLTTYEEETREEQTPGTGNIGSKAQEGTSTREAFNDKFSIVEAGNTENTSITKNSNGEQTGTLTYNLENDYTEGVQKATLITNNEQLLITAKTSEAGYKLEDYFVPGRTEIKNINLGLKQREQPDMALYKDLDNVRITINGHGHTYKYAQRFKNYGLDSDTGFNVGVKYEEKYNTDLSYKRAIYKEDYLFESEDKSRELKVSMTYAIKLVNQSTDLVTQINSIIDYYDSNYTKVVSVGRQINDDGTVINDNTITVEERGLYKDSGYNQALITTNSKLDPGTADTIYVQFDLNRQAVVNILNEQTNLNNVSEIYSYSIFDRDGKIYAGIDQDSNPGSCNPSDRVTYQDDTDRAPEILLETADARKITGTVFVDSTSGELQVGQERQGNGVYDDGETVVPNVHITLTENSGTGLVYEANTDENGNFEISSFIPGTYTLTYTWGNETYTVQNYKGTIYNNKDRQNDTHWYYDEETRNSDAMDNYETRKAIDAELQTIKHDTQSTITTMNSTTPTMSIEVEDNVPVTDSTGDRYEYIIRNVDFGIVERARQEIALTKRVKTVKLTLANGNVLSDAVIEMKEDGTYEITGTGTNYLTHMGPSSTTIPANGYVRMELDTEIMQGATLEVGYEFIVANNSELDYNTEEYYKYGENKTNVITITPKTIIDYLDSDWGYEEDKNPDWKQIKTIEELQNLNLVDAVVYESENSNIANTRILYTEKLQDQKLEPTQTASVELNVSKLLSSSDDIELGNEAEIATVEKTGGPDITSTPGNYVPGSGKTESDDSPAETTIVTPNTGDNQAFIVPTIIGIIALVILGVGVVLIRKFNIARG